MPWLTPAPEIIRLHLIALLPALAALWWMTRAPLASVFQRVYLPVLLLLPNYYRCFLPGLPDLTFNQAAILPIFVLFLAQRPYGWRFSVTDLLVLLFAASVGYSEYASTTYKDAQNLLVDMAASVVMPYVLAKGLIESSGERERTARVIAVCTFVVALISVYEFRMGVTPFRKLLDPFFPGQAYWVTTFRWGFVRIAGPYGHAILAGVILTVGFRLSRYLQWVGAWPRWARLPERWPLSSGVSVSLGLAAGVLMSMCRGPWLGAGLASAIANVARVRRRQLIVRLGVLAILVVGVPVAAQLWSWASVGRENATSISQETAAYRKELIDNYVDIALVEAWWGWGKTTWPKLASMPSIDNYYLLLLLQHGAVSLLLLVSLFLWMGLRLYRRGRDETDPRDTAFAWTLLAIWGSVVLNLLFVYLGETLMPLLFVLAGWMEGFLRPARIAPDPQPPPFQRILQ